MLDKTKKDNRIKVLRGQLQKMANIGIDWEGMARKHATPLTHKEHQTHSWLSPSGEFYDLDEFGNSEHQQWIKTLLDKHGDKDLTKQYSRDENNLGEGFEDDMDDVAFMGDSNFIRLNSDGYKELDIGTANEPTSAQNKAIQDLAISRGFKSDNVIVDGYYPGTEENYDGEKQLRRRMGLNKLGKLKVLRGKLQKMATDINRAPVDNNMSKSDEIINSFQNSGLSIEGVDGVYDTENHKILDANNSDDVERLRGLYGKDKYIGTNSETDTRDGPNTNDLERTRKELQDIEDKGGIPALGFDSTEGGSLEALNVSVVNSKEEVLQALNKNQWGTGILHPNGKFEIVKSLKYIGRNK